MITAKVWICKCRVISFLFIFLLERTMSTNLRSFFFWGAFEDFFLEELIFFFSLKIINQPRELALKVHLHKHTLVEKKDNCRYMCFCTLPKLHPTYCLKSQNVLINRINKMSRQNNHDRVEFLSFPSFGPVFLVLSGHSLLSCTPIMMSLAPGQAPGPTSLYWAGIHGPKKHLKARTGSVMRRCHRFGFAPIRDDISSQYLIKLTCDLA